MKPLSSSEYFFLWFMHGSRCRNRRWWKRMLSKVRRRFIKREILKDE